MQYLKEPMTFAIKQVRMCQGYGQGKFAPDHVDKSRQKDYMTLRYSKSSQPRLHLQNVSDVHVCTLFFCLLLVVREVLAKVYALTEVSWLV